MSHKQIIDLMSKTKLNHYLIVCNFTQSDIKQTASSVLEAKTAADALSYYQRAMCRLFERSDIFVSEIQFNISELGAKELNLNSIIDSAITFDYTPDT